MRFPLSRSALVLTVSLCLLFCSTAFAGHQEQPDPPSSPSPVAQSPKPVPSLPIKLPSLGLCDRSCAWPA